jgi:hypothetical protein
VGKRLNSFNILHTKIARIAAGTEKCFNKFSIKTGQKKAFPEKERLYI